MRRMSQVARMRERPETRSGLEVGERVRIPSARSRTGTRPLIALSVEESDRATLAQVLEQVGYETATAPDVVEAFACCEWTRPDLFVLDSAFNGGNVLRSLGICFGDIAPPVILLCDGTGRPDQLAALYPSCHLLSKPCNSVDLVRLATRLLVRSVTA